MLNFYAPINTLGYGVHTYNFMRALTNLGVEVALFPISSQYYVDSYVERWIENQNKFSKEDIGIMLFHENYMNKFYGLKRIGFLVFETGLRELDVKLLTSLDYILQPSNWGKQYLNKLGFDNVFVIPEGYEPSVFNPSVSSFDYKLKVLKDTGIVFSHVGKYEERKSTSDIFRVFAQSLDGMELKCKLIAHVRNIFLPNWEKIVSDELQSLGFSVSSIDSSVIKFHKNNLIILVIREALKSVIDIYSQSHFGIYVSKAEGFNLPLIESLACGVPCVVTDWTGQSEYLKDYPKELIVEKGEEVVARDNVWFFGDRGSWIKPDLSSFKNILINLAKEPLKYLGLSSRCQNCVKDFTWKNSAQKFIDLVGQLGIKL